MKFPFSRLSRAPALISTPLPLLPEIVLPSGGTTKTGVTVPLSPVGSLAWPAAGFSPIRLPFEATSTPLPWLPAG